MPKRSSRKKRLPDPNTLAFNIVRTISGEAPPAPALLSKPKNQAVVELGRLGGIKGGPARAAKLSARRRAAIARQAARTRWQKTS
jgi:hypothetical protein